MKTIRKILDYDLSSYEIDALISCEIVNWCWWKWWFNFDKVIEQNIEIIPWFNQKKSKKFFDDLRMICIEHDIDFRFKKWFYFSNYVFANKLYKLIRWSKKKKWATRRQAFSVSLIAFVLLCKYWKQFYYL